jgi:hypothetical protein
MRKTSAKYKLFSSVVKTAVGGEGPSLLLFYLLVEAARARAHPPPPPRLGRAPGSNEPGGPRRRKQSRLIICLRLLW